MSSKTATGKPKSKSGTKVPLSKTGGKSLPSAAEKMKTVTSGAPAAVPLSLLNDEGPQECISQVFEISPMRIVFLQSEANSTYEAKLSFMNKTKVNQFLRVAQPNSQFFKVTAPKGSESTLKVAPGLSVTYKVIYTPAENINISSELNVKTETEEFFLPILAFPKCATLELPNEFRLENCPVKATSKKALFIKNTFSEPCTWRAVVIGKESENMASLFALSPSFGSLAPLQVLPIEVSVTPSTGKSVNATLRFFLGPEGDVVQDLPVVCTTSELLTVGLDSQQVVFEDTFVTTEQQKTVTLRNNSDKIVQFCWKSNYRKNARDTFTTGTGRTSTDIGAEQDDLDGFDDEVFSIEPVSGELYGGGEKTFTVIFCPQLAVLSEVTAFLEVSGRLDPLPLRMIGSGLGPQCELEFDKLNIGDIYMNALHEYEVELENVGCIEARFTVLETDSLMGQKFSFSPTTGALQPGEKTVLKVELKSDLIGVINEIFKIHLYGSLDELSLQFKGRVVGPSFQFNVDELDFGNVSYNFWHQRPFKITNTGHVSMSYNLRLADAADGFSEEEFVISPSKGTIPANSSASIVLEYLSNTPGELETALLVDIEDVGDAVDSIPVKAACMVAPLTLSQNRIGYGSCFINYEYSMNAEVVNDTSLSGKFRLCVVDPKGIENKAKMVIGDPEAETDIIILGPHSKVQVPLALRVLSVGELAFSIALQILGDEGSPQTILINATGCGPNVDVQQTAINFGSVNVLETVEKTVLLHNTSPIEAKFKVVFTKAEEKRHSTTSSKRPWEAESVFRTEPEEGVIEPFGDLIMKVFVRADEAMTFNDSFLLDIQYAEGSVEPIALKAIGKGFPFRTEEDVSNIDFGDVFTDTPVSREVIVYNEGRKEQEVQWHNVRGSKVKEGAPPIVFKFKPERCIIPPKESFTFVVSGAIAQVGVFSDTLTLKQSGTFKEILSSNVKANFLEPLLLCSTRQLQFEYVEQVEVNGTLLDGERNNVTLQSFTLKNVTPKDLEVSLKIVKQKGKSPFNFEGPNSFNLASGETNVVGITFNPHYLGDSISHNVKNQIQISFSNHSRTETVTVSGKICFPSLTIEPDTSVVDFGTIVKDTESQQEIILHNPSNQLSAAFHWELVGEDDQKMDKNAVKRFDFAPFDGIIAPGGSQKIVATFYGMTGKYETKARCLLRGGPTYDVQLKGAAGDVNIMYDTTSLNFGVLQYYAQASKTITISNPSHVAVNFSVDMHTLKIPGRVCVTPMSGKITEKTELKVMFCPQVPDEIHEHFFIQVGHFDPQRIDVTGRGQINSIALSGKDEVAKVTRAISSGFEECFHDLKQKQQRENSSVPLYVSKLSADLTSTPKHVDPVAVEAERLAFCHSIIKKQTSLSITDGIAIPVATPPVRGSTDGTKKKKSITTAATSQTQKKKKSNSPQREASEPVTSDGEDDSQVYEEPLHRAMRRNSTTARGSTKFVLAKYSVDFGHMTRNDVKTSKISVTNTSAENLFLMIDSKEIARMPMVVAPLKVTQLPPLSEVDFTITLDARPPGETEKESKTGTASALDTTANARKKTITGDNAPIAIAFGDNYFEFAIDIKGGPVILVEAHCFVATPTLNLGTSHLNFGDVLLGQVKVLPLSLTNEQTVPCEWRLSWQKKEKDNSKKKLRGIPSGYQPKREDTQKDEEEEEADTDIFPFWVNMDRGVLDAHQSITVEVFFSPIKPRNYSPTLKFRFVNNSKPQDILCTGGTRLYNVVVNPDARLQCPVVRPFQVIHEKICLTNNEDVPVEVFSYNLDETHAQEFSIVQRALENSGEKQLFLPPRNAGDFLAEPLLESVYQDVTNLEKALEYTPPIHTSPSGEFDAQRPSSARKQSAKSSKRASRLSIERATTPLPEPEQPPQPPLSFTLFIGGPQSGKTYCSSQLSSSAEGSFAVVDWDTLVREAAKQDSVEGDVLRSALSVISAHSVVAASTEKGPKLELPNQPPNPFDLPQLYTILGPITGTSGNDCAAVDVAQTKNIDGAHFVDPFKAVAVNPILLNDSTSANEYIQGSRNNSRPNSRTNSRSGTPNLGATTGSMNSVGSFAMDQGQSLSPANPKLLLKVITKILKSFLETTVRTYAAEGRLFLGFVMDSLSCSIFYDQIELLKVVRTICDDLKCQLKIINLEISELTMGLRYTLQQQTLWEKKVEDAQVDPLSEDEYALLNAEDREIYNLRLKYYSDCKRELQRITKQVKEFEENIANNQDAQTVQKQIEQAYESQHSPEEMKNTKKSTKAAANNDVTGKGQASKVKGGMISPLNNFKEFYETLVDIIQSEAQAAPVGRGKEAPAPTLGNYVKAVNSESDKETVFQEVISSLQLVTVSLSQAGIRIEDRQNKSPAGNSRPVTFADQQSSSQDVSAISSSESRLGLWNYIDKTRLKLMEFDKVNFVRFFSEVMTEVQIATKGKAAAKQAPKQSSTVHNMCEMTRWIIPPKSSSYLTVEFCCDKDGDHLCKTQFGIVGTLQTLPFEVFAQAALPDIARDERKIFPNTRPRLAAGKNPAKAFLMAKRLYDFGSLLIPLPATNGKRRKSKDERLASISLAGNGASMPTAPLVTGSKEILTFSNPGVSETEIVLTFEKEKDNVFLASPMRFTIPPNQSQNVTLEANPTECGDFTNVLVASIKDNPDPWYINTKCVGTRPALTFDDGTKSLEVDLGRTVVNRPTEKVMTLYNTSSLPIMWSLAEQDKLPDEIRFSESSGVIDEFGVQPVTLQFYPTTTCLHSVSLQVQVADAKSGMVYESLPLTVKAEGHDVVLEWTKEINYGLCHVGDSKTEVMRIMNKSPYDVGYQIRVPKKLQGIITVSPQAGTIRGMVGHKEAAIANIEVTAAFDKEGELPKRVSLLEVAFLHPEERELLYPLQLIPVNGEAWYTKYSIKPSSGVDFGSCFFNQKKQRTFEIHNTGRFPISYHLFDVKVGHESVTEGLPPRGDASQGKKSKIKNVETELQMGCFSAYPCRDVIPVSEFRTITLDALLPNASSVNHERLGIYVEQSGPEEENRGTVLDIVAHPASPGIVADLTNPSDVESIFEEQQVVYRLDQFERGIRAYGREDRTFSFGSVLVNQKEEERFRIANSSPLPTTVVVQLLPNAPSTSGTKGTGGSSKQQILVEGFELVPDGDSPVSNTARFTLPPFENKFVTVRFTPSALQRYTGHIVATVENGPEGQNNSLIFSVSGEGTLPNVEYILPPHLGSDLSGLLASEANLADGNSSQKGTSPGSSINDSSSPGGPSATKNKSKNKKSVSSSVVLEGPTIDNDAIDIPLTLVGETSSRSFRIRNTGTVIAVVRVAIVSEENDCGGFSLSRRNEDVSIYPGTEEEFEIEFTPTSVGKASMRLYATVLHNPFVDRELKVVAQSFAQPISFEGIDAAVSDLLDLGCTYLEQPATYTIGLKNNTTEDIRYEWQTEDNSAYSLNWLPKVGHLSAGSVKEITLTLLSKGITSSRSIAMGNVKIQSIELTEEATWDSSIVDQKWVVVPEDVNSGAQRSYGGGGRRNLKKVMEPVAEPNHKVTDALVVTQRLRVAYLCDVPAYSLGMVDTSEDGESGRRSLITEFDRIVFPTTKLFQRRIVTLSLTNHSRVALSYHFRILAAASGVTTNPSEIEAQSGSNMNNNNNKTTVEGEESDAGETERGFIAPGNDFSVEPDSKGTLGAGETRSISVIFSPFSTGEVPPRLLECEFPFCADPIQRFQLMGTGECPLIHVQVPPNDYLSLRVDGEAGPAVDPKSVVLEFLTRGLHTQASIRFQVLNPTGSSYPFEWSEITHGSLSPFKCLTPSGVIGAGKWVEMGFEFSGETLGVRERLWNLTIPGKNASVPFLLVGKATDPAVFFSGSKLHFGGINLGGKAEKVLWLENRDEVPFTFSFNKAELKTMTSFLSVRPASGTIGPKEKLPITVLFTPQDEMEYNIPLSCQVKKASIPLKVNVKGTGVCVHDTLIMEPFVGHPSVVPVQKDNLMVINLGRVQIDERVTRTFILSNTGSSPFEYVVSIPERRFVSIENSNGHISPKERAAFTLVYHPTSEESLKQFRMQVKIGGKVGYQIGVQATTYVPKLQLSYDKYDFGPRFTKSFNPIGGEISTTLGLFNHDKEEVTVECSLSEGVDWFEIDRSSFVVKPGDRQELKITFHPTDVRLYADKLKFVLNGSYPMTVPLAGEGVQPRVEVTNHFAKFGTTRIGEKRDVELRLECRSRIPTPVSFLGCVTDELSDRGVSFASPQQGFTMKPKENRIITLSYRPLRRMTEFQREMKMIVCGREYPFALLSGACEDAETQLDTTVVQFNDIVVGSASTKRVIIMNTGDLAQKFNWRDLPNTGEITVNPASGFMRPHTEFVCEFHYRPCSATSSMNQTIRLELERASDITLQLEATAMNRPPAKDTIRFRCKARQVDTQKIAIENTSNEAWTFSPVIDSLLWSAPHSITLKAKTKGEVEVQYAPMRETKGRGDVANLFIPQDNGKGLSYTLEGISDPAGPSGPLRELDTTTRETITANFNVTNWSGSATRFTRQVEWTSPTNIEEGLITVNGPATVDVTPQSSAECSLTLKFVKEGQYRGIVHFKCTSNVDLNQYYELHVRVSSAAQSPSLTAMVELRSPVRQSALYNIPVGNPLAKAITVNCKLEGPAESLAAVTLPSTVTVPPKNVSNVTAEFFPLLHREYTPVKVLLTSPDIDGSAYTLKLISLPAVAQPLTRLNCPLGQSTPFTIRFTHFAKVNAEYNIKIGGEPSAAANATSKNASPPLFTRGTSQAATIKAPAIVAAGKGQEMTAEFIYEPRSIGNTKESIEFISNTGGSYTFPILAVCTAPSPQGPYSFKAGQSIQIPFKNVFADAVSVQISTDSPIFTVGKKVENVAAKKSINISVQCKIDNNAAAGETFFARLLVSCVPPGESKSVEWVYYLEGTKDGKKK